MHHENGRPRILPESRVRCRWNRFWSRGLSSRENGSTGDRSDGSFTGRTSEEEEAVRLDPVPRQSQATSPVSRILRKNAKDTDFRTACREESLEPMPSRPRSKQPQKMRRPRAQAWPVATVKTRKRIRPQSSALRVQRFASRSKAQRSSTHGKVIASPFNSGGGNGIG